MNNETEDAEEMASDSLAYGEGEQKKKSAPQKPQFFR